MSSPRRPAGTRDIPRISPPTTPSALQTPRAVRNTYGRFNNGQAYQASSASRRGRHALSSDDDDDDDDDMEDEEEEEEEDGDVDGNGSDEDRAGPSTAAAPTAQAHLTPHHNRSARQRRPPAWVTDGVQPLVSQSRAKAAASPTTPRRRRANGKRAGSSDSSGEDDVPETPSRRPRTADKRTNGTTPTAKRLDSIQAPATPTSVAKRKARATVESEELPALPVKGAATTPRRQPGKNTPGSATPTTTRPRPIKRPRVSSGATPRRSKSASAAATPSKSKFLPDSGPTEAFIKPTSADYYFAAHAARRKSAASKNESWTTKAAQAAAERAARRGLADLPSLQPSDIAKLSQPGSSSSPLSVAGLVQLGLTHYRMQYPTWSSLLFLGNDLVFYGLGAKENVLEDFARSKAEEGDANVVIIRGRMGTRPEEWVDSIEEALDLPPLAQGGAEQRLRRIVDAYPADDSVDDRGGDAPARLLIVLHSLDAPALLAPRARAHLQALSTSPSIHIIASVSHPSAALLADYTAGHKPQLWIDCTTLLPHTNDCLLSGAGARLAGLPRAFDLGSGSLGFNFSAGASMANGGGAGQHAAGERDTGVPGVGAAGGGGGLSSAAEMHASSSASAPLLGSTAALHVLRSVTYKARALFLKLASELRASEASKSDGASTGAGATFASRSIPFSRLLHLATRNFIATSEPALRALLVEFTSHGLVRVYREEQQQQQQHGPGGGGAAEERVAIRMDGEREVEDVVRGVTKL